LRRDKRRADASVVIDVQARSEYPAVDFLKLIEVDLRRQRFDQCRSATGNQYEHRGVLRNPVYERQQLPAGLEAGFIHQRMPRLQHRPGRPGMPFFGDDQAHRHALTQRILRTLRHGDGGLAHRHHIYVSGKRPFLQACTHAAAAIDRRQRGLKDAQKIFPMTG
jgi:hypothetical protein